MQNRFSTAVFVFAFFFGTVSAGAQQLDADFFRGKTVTYVVSSAAGGGYDTYGRLVSRHMSKYMPGTRFVVRNVPGAGNIVGANTIYTSRPDGLTMGTFVTGLIYAQLLEQEGVRFDLAKMSWIGRVAEEGRSLVLSSNSEFKSAQDLLNADRPILISTAGIGATNHIETRVLAYALGLDVKLVPNMQTAEALMSMVRGEVDGVLGSDSSYDNFTHQGSGKYVLTITGARSDIPGVPQAREFIVHDEVRPIFAFIERMAGLGRIQVGPPGIPPARLAALRDAFNKAVTDPEFLAEAEMLKLPVAPGTGEEVEESVRTLLDQTPETIALLRRIAVD